MKRTPKSFDATMKQVPKQLVLGEELEDEQDSLQVIDEDADTGSLVGEDLSITLNRLQVSSEMNAGYPEDAGNLSSSQTSTEDAVIGEMRRGDSVESFKKSSRRSSSKRKKKFEDSDLLASLANNGPSMQEEEEATFARCLDSGVRSAQLTGFFFARDEEQKQFTVFRLEIATVAQTWIVFRRYSDFVTLASKLQDNCPPNFPPKTPFGGNFAKEFLFKRQGLLSAWLEKALAVPGLVTMPDVRTFLVSEANCTPASLLAEVEQAKSSTSSATSNADMDLVTPKRQTTNAAPIASTPPGIKEGMNEQTPRSNLKSPHAQNPRKVNLGDFELLQVLGKGSFGKVLLALKRTGRDANTLYAMKILNKQNVVNKKQVEHTLTERSVLGKMNHPFIVKLHYAFQTEQKLHFVLDYCPGGELFFHLGRAGKFSEHQGRFYAAEMTLALGHLHSNGVVYRDLKPENILFEASGHLKLADFGLSKEGVESTQGSHSFCGTPEYLAPEILNRSGHGTAVDWWSLGALLYEMLTGLPPWFSRDRQKLFLGIRQAPLRFPPDVSPLARSILGDFLKRDPMERLGCGGVEQVKNHPFFATMDWVALYELRIPPPFVPRVSGDSDTGNFDPQFTRMPLVSDAHSPMMVAASPASLVAASSSALLTHHQPPLQQLKKPASASTPEPEVSLFGGFTYQEEYGMATPPTPYSTSGLCSPPLVMTNKRTSPLRPGLNMYHARPSSSNASSLARTPTFVPARSPTVSG